MDLKNIIIDKKEIGTLIGAAKRKWAATKKTVTRTDEISKPEGTLFVNDVELARMVKAQKILDEQIATHIDAVLEESRGYNQSEINEKKESALVNLLSEVLVFFNELIECELESDERENLNDLIGRLGNMINEMEEAE